MSNEHIINKIRKLRNKAEATEFNAESEAFAKAAARLIEDYGIDESELAGETKEIGQIIFSRNDLGNSSYGYCRLFWDIAPLFRCAALANVSDICCMDELKNKRTAKIWLYGSDEDMALVRSLIDDILVNQMLLCVIRDRPRSRKSYAAAWSLAVADRIADAQRDYCSELNALIPTNTEAQEAAQRDSSGTSKTTLDYDSVQAGNRAAQNADLGQTKVTTGTKLIGS